MFERYSEQARRAIFFARFEASTYGSYTIETEHLLLGLLREFPNLHSNVRLNQVREEVEKHVTRGERISTSVDMPLSGDSKKALNVAAEEAERVSHRIIGLEHLLLGILHIEGSLAARILNGRKINADAIRKQISKGSFDASPPAKKSVGAAAELKNFLSSLRLNGPHQPGSFFSKIGRFVDRSGRAWSREEIDKEYVSLFAPYAKRNATLTIEHTLVDTGNLLVATVLWKNAILASEQRAWNHRMSVVLVPEGDDWTILLVQVTPVELS
jgi:ClpA/ClpB-like protein